MSVRHCRSREREMGTGDKGEEEREIREVVEKGQDGMINEEEEVRR